MYAKFSLPGSDHKFSPFHSNNFSGAIGGPIIPHHQFFFFFGVEPLRSSASTGNATDIFPDPAFAAFAQANFPNTFGTKILNTYTPSIASGNVVKTANDIFPGTCGTAATSFLPCATPMLDSGVFNSTNFRNGTQYFVRVDKYFKHDRIYGSFFRTLLNYGGPNVIPQFSTTNNNWERAVQVNWTHDFSPTTLNEVIFAQNRIEGKLGETGDFTIPGVTVTGQNVGYGVGFAQGDFIQHNYHWRDVLTHVRGAHVIKVGYEGWYGDDVEPFQGPWSHPGFSFDNLLTLAQDAPHTEGGVMYNPITGQQQLWNWNAASKTWGIFAEDTWKAKRNLTVTFGFRFDDQGNPYSKSDSTVFGNFYLGSGSSFQDEVAGGVAKPTHNALLGAPKAYQPRIGVAWDINGKGDWLVTWRIRNVFELAHARKYSGRISRQSARLDQPNVLCGLARLRPFSSKAQAANRRLASRSRHWPDRLYVRLPHVSTQREVSSVLVLPSVESIHTSPRRRRTSLPPRWNAA